MNSNQPIAAIATAKGESAIAMIRCSGNGIIEIGNRLFNSGDKLSNAISGQFFVGWIKHPKTGEKIDQVVIAVYRAPRSYTGEDMLEISTHGGKSAPYAVLDIFIENGCRIAAPGEFTRRAFINGKMNLAQADGVKEIIRARTQEQRRKALFQIQGQSYKGITEIKKKIEERLMRIEACLEFPEENIEGYDKNKLIEEMKIIWKEAEEILKASKEMRKLKDGIIVPIVGSTNAGKSTLFNFLMQNERVIVDSHPGTTRDAVEEELEIKGRLVRIIDTAGIRKTKNAVEKKGITKTKEYLRLADIILWVHDLSKSENKEEIEWIQEYKEKTIMSIYNKADLVKKRQKEGFCISLKQRTGINEFIKEFEKKIVEKTGQAHDFALSSTYQIQCLSNAGKGILKFVKELKKNVNMGEEIIAIELRQILSDLAEISGEISSQELLDKIFGEFCVGK
jgi:tRNA modification GTPase